MTVALVVAAEEVEEEQDYTRGAIGNIGFSRKNQGRGEIDEHVVHTEVWKTDTLKIMKT